MATAAAVALSALTNRSVKVSRELQDLSSSSVNVVHVPRPHLAVAQHPFKLLTKPGLQVGAGRALLFLLEARLQSMQLHQSAKQA
jgi:hypothetical protein